MCVCVCAAQSPTVADPLQQAYAGVQHYAGESQGFVCMCFLDQHLHHITAETLCIMQWLCKQQSAVMWPHFTVFSAACTHFQNFTHKSKNHTHKMPHISCKMKHCIQNITNTSQKQTFANTFDTIVIPVRFVCVS